MAFSMKTPRDGFIETIILDPFACKTEQDQAIK
jgi:hypothetical protein